MDFSLNETQVTLCESLKAFARRELNENVHENDAASQFPWEGWKKCADMGVMGLPIPTLYQGQGVDILTTVLCLEALSSGCKDSGLIHAIIAHMLCALQILSFGTEEQKQKYLPRACRGELVFAQAITEADSGSDALNMKTKADKNGNGYKLTGAKMFISNGPIADVVLAFAVTNSERKNFGGISAILVEKGDTGFAQCKAMEKMGLRTLQNGELVFTDCMVPADRVLGREGLGMPIFMEGMRLERTLLFACHLGVMQRSLETCVKYSEERKQGGQPIGKHEFIMDKIARMIMNLEMARLILYKSAWLIDQKKRSDLEASISKLFISESLKNACLDAVQIHGAYGYMKEFEIERDLRDSVASTIYSGTTEIQKIIISRLAKV